MEVIKFAKEHENIYLDLSAAFASIATKMALTELPERCLYSSDAPYGEPYLYRHLIEFVVIQHPRCSRSFLYSSN